jgi:hypothetical protein
MSCSEAFRTTRVVCVLSGTYHKGSLTRRRVAASVSPVLAVSVYVRGGYLRIAGAEFGVKYVPRLPPDTDNTHNTRRTLCPLVRAGM